MAIDKDIRDLGRSIEKMTRLMSELEKSTSERMAAEDLHTEELQKGTDEHKKYLDEEKKVHDKKVKATENEINKEQAAFKKAQDMAAAARKARISAEQKYTKALTKNNLQSIIQAEKKSSVAIQYDSDIQAAGGRKAWLVAASIILVAVIAFFYHIYLLLLVYCRKSGWYGGANPGSKSFIFMVPVYGYFRIYLPDRRW